jgi:hypothetical protein
LRPNTEGTFAYLQHLVGYLIASPQVLVGLDPEATVVYNGRAKELQEEALLRFEEMLKPMKNDTDGQRTVHFWRVRSFAGCRVTDLTKDNAKYLASSLNWLLEHQKNSTHDMHEAMHEVFDSVAHLDLQIVEMIEDGGSSPSEVRDAILNQVMIDEFSNLMARQWEKYGKDLYATTDKVCQYHSGRGNLRCNELGLVEVPGEFIQDRFFYTLFPGLTQVRALSVFGPPLSSRFAVHL